MIGALITLDEGEQSVAKFVAQARQAENRAEGVINSKRGPQSDYITDLEGVASEMAFCKLYNLYPDFTVYVRSSQKGEDAGDVVWRGNIIDVKSTRYKNGKLLAVLWKKSTVDAFALMVGEFPSYVFKGFMRRQDLIQDSRLGDLGHGPVYIAAQSELVDDISAKE